MLVTTGSLFQIIIRAMLIPTMAIITTSLMTPALKRLADGSRFFNIINVLKIVAYFPLDIL
ncbi:hypothetical protein BpHYR1_000477 [Brachionus plicatilis]|uniref:Uncharacterized protein n=1 Tax=Brachionus plicatilis TaxID=10195 RepID=A0A3M7RMI1_BRAPC|nr:hypothetical protein BpHYR1_000477 [Brachionus plicatilis]